MADSPERVKFLVIIGTLAHMGGAERQALYLARHIAGLRHCEVELLAFEDGEALRPELASLGIRVHVLPYYFRWPKLRRLRALSRLVALLRFQIRPDALLPFVGIHSKTVAMVWPYTRARFCWWNQQDEGRDLTGTSLERKILRKVSSINSNSDAGRDFLASTYSLSPSSIHVYNNGTPIPAETLKSWKREHGLEKRRIVSMIANVTSYKDHETLLRAWALLRKDIKGERPLLVLAGHLRETDTVNGLKLRAFELGLSIDDVRFVGPIDNVASLIADSDLVVHSSTTEGCPNAVCEAMAVGKPVVATDIPGCRQALGSREWLAAPGNAPDLAQLMLRILEDSSLRTSLGGANLERIRSEFTIDGMNQFFTGEIERVLGPLG